MQHPWPPPDQATNGLSPSVVRLVAPARENESKDPLDAVLSIGGHAGWAVALAFVAAIVFHGAAGARAMLIDPWLL